ncbi:MAG: DUF63 family protein [Euryarchaeota archaeon]|nr:DUF63 family protein [Euryarchaeota archaeon]
MAYQGFTPANTVVYALLFLALLLGTVRLFRTFRPDLRLFYAYFVPFVLLGSGLRVMGDLGLLSSPLFGNIGIYAFIYALLLGSILLGRWSTRFGLQEHHLPLTLASVGCVYVALRLLPLSWQPEPLLLALLPTLALASALYLAFPRLGLRLLDSRVNLAILAAHLLDATTTYLGLTLYGLREEVLLTRFLVSLDPLLIFPLKAGIVLAALHYLDDLEDEVSKTLLRAALLGLGLGPAARNLLLEMLI